MRFQVRDGNILLAIFYYDGVLAKRQIKSIFWPNKTSRAMEQRLTKLFRSGYIDWPSREQRKTKPIPEPICWLGWRGALNIAGEHGIKVKQPRSENENQLRIFQNRLRKHGIRWVREPRWSLLGHDVAVVDFRIMVEKAIMEIPYLTLETWIPESEFHSNTDVVSYEDKTSSGRIKRIRKGVCPDGYFEIINEDRRAKGEPHKAKFLLEVDMATHDNPSFGREKVSPGVAYIKSPAYKARFGSNEGNWLVVTSGGNTRLKNLMRQAREKAQHNAGLFFFTTFDQLVECEILTAPIWWQVDQNKPKSLLSS